MDIMEIMEQDSSVRPHRCNWAGCNKAFNRRSDLDRHYRIHTNERPYRCEFKDCGKSFIQQSALTVHRRTHTGEKPHTCIEKGCGRKFSDSSSLARHRRIHSGKRPYKCGKPGCEKSFCRKTTMIKHQRRPHPTGSSGSDNPDGDIEVDVPFSPPTPPNAPYNGRWVAHVFSGTPGRQSSHGHMQPSSPLHPAAHQPDCLVFPGAYHPRSPAPRGDTVRHELPSNGCRLNGMAPLPSSNLMHRSTIGSNYASPKTESDSETSTVYGVKQENYDTHSSFQSIPEAPHHPGLAQDQVSVHSESMAIQASQDMYMPVPTPVVSWYDYTPSLPLSTISHQIPSYVPGLYSFMEPKLEFNEDPSMQLPSVRLLNE
ncbi:unnamed protein product [Clonostachys rosea]|uniref:C2H2-type domain-containing protein n=1 Tax=Bionectria ochroleuca TaxID=29856 RepID=A0ABY6UYW8_BIOOC|nr:unnamed protein product [Clonostachys rosea]